MLQLPQDLMQKVSALKWLSLDQIKEQYKEYLAGCEKCERVDVVRSIAAYRIQERFYNISVSPKVRRAIEVASAGKRLTEAPADAPKAAKKIIKNWKGKTYEILFFDDKNVEYDGVRYGSLTAAAKAITGTHWNGRNFFGVN